MNQFRKLSRYITVTTAFILFCLCYPALSAEVIRSFDSNLRVASDGTLTVTETIRVRAEGHQIRRGIYRDFPLLFEDDNGRRVQVGFKLISVSRDGKPDGSRVEHSSDRVRIYIGNKDYFLPTGEYTYKIIYETDRQIRFFENHDEIYWNATGNFWDFPIESATAKVILPEGVSATNTAAFTGRVGSTEQAARISEALDGNVVNFVTTRPLGRGEGLTIAVMLPKGAITPPTQAQETAWFLNDYRAEIIAVVGLLVTALFYLITWVRIGRDPPSGVIVPRWDPPDGISPALTSYIYKMGISGKGWDAISAAILNLAVKGLVTLENLKGDLTIRTTGVAPEGKLPVGERAILNVVRSYSGEMIVSDNHGSKVKKLQNKFESAMTSEHRSDYYNHNVWVIVGGVVLSVLTIFTILFFGRVSEDTIGFFFLFGFISVFIGIFIFHITRALTSARSLASKFIAIIGSGIFAFMAFSGILRALANLVSIIPSSFLMSIVVGVVLLNVLFFFLMGAPTPTGQHMMDGIKGLKQYLNLAEKERMNLAGAPEMSPQHYETLLPYAVALGVEKPWSKAFDAWLAAAVAAGAVAASYSPGWYHGRDFNSGNIGDSMRDISDGMQSSFSSAMPVPKSSSSGFSGGGSSGGGGGGGGGGGW